MKTRPTLAQAKAQYPNRYTREHVPAWAKNPHHHTSGPFKGKTLYYAPQFATDLQWYENTVFDGESPMADKNACYTSNQNWPCGTWLDEPFKPALGY